MDAFKCYKLLWELMNHSLALRKCGFCKHQGKSLFLMTVS